MGIAEHGQLHTAERRLRRLAHKPQRLVDGIHQVGADHGDLVDNQKLEAPQNTGVATGADHVRG